ncbi:hypothetical protein DTO271D3_7432 [Paecilomyces variotii]|nr:hypothetical protein DTO212C5_16 [Paecilomyces variotii]KAJ9304903.1 hypothetical protein DTO217A2_5556 [Paecilomyces variotii]KAJ9312274.1 hypothetical protein DTO271D3_7432 [Paecilomyces variotii]KAJ9328342.1 hypothetical protein DTO027B3_1379 [Paecilomyces variotii]KAJ9336522.1 hypothetical protein DTO027B5_1837 [Paecilomyces variotii]
MAGMEELEIHSKSYLVRWVHVKAEHTISWSIQPHKKSLNFGIFKHPGHAAGQTPHLPVSGAHSSDGNETPAMSSAGPRQNVSSVVEKLTAIGLKPIQWIGKCEADKISQGTYDVPTDEGGNYALVFDNTFSKQISKTATFVLLTYPTATPPQSAHHVHHSQALAGASSNGPPGAKSVAGESIESLRHTRSWGRSVPGGNTKRPPQSADSDNPFPATVHTGILHKRRRKRHQGWARRFFSLDFATSTLSYYHNRNSSALRGAIPLTLAAVAANAETREISIDSGAEIWHLRASNDQDFSSWKRALEKASKPASEERQSDHLLRVPSRASYKAPISAAEEREWMQAENLVSKLSGTRDAVRRLAKDTDPKYPNTAVVSPGERPRNRSPSPHPGSSETNGGEDYLDSKERRSFWKRKPSNNAQVAPKRNVATSQLAVPTPVSDSASVTGERKPRSIASQSDHENPIHDNLMAVLRDLDDVVAEFTVLLEQSKQRRNPASLVAQSRMSMESDISQEFFDATDGGEVSPLLTIQRDSEDEAGKSGDENMADNDSLSGSEVDDIDAPNGSKLDHLSSLFPAKPKSLAPLPLNSVKRRTNIPAPTVLPPSLIGFLRKNVGKDLSQISMPVSANEPLSLLQRAAENLEYSNLLDTAANCSDGLERLLYVTAFALASLSNNRVKERAIRKPFNPMLGETYELIREDRGFRFIAEKVSHRPVQLAYQAETKDWSLAQSPMPTQKFWGKSAEIITEGKIRLILHSSGDRFSWTPATCFLRNIIAGEKYVEPVGEMSVVNETTGQKTVSTFKAGGMFSGRSEEVSVKALSPHGEELPLGLTGSWPSSLVLTERGATTKKAIWSAGPLVEHAPKHYGLTAFAASLNEITPIEKGRLPATDSRLRPDQRALEEGDLDRAEELKVRLEDKQRARRRDMEDRGDEWKPRWFTRVDGLDGNEAVWRLKTGRDGYWDERARNEWKGVVPVFEV